MRRILLDENAPVGLKGILTGYEVRTAPEMGWAGVENGALLAAAELAGFDILVTADRNIRAQQNLAGRKIALVILGTNHWLTIKSAPARVLAACAGAGEGATQLCRLRPVSAARDAVGLGEPSEFRPGRVASMI